MKSTENLGNEFYADTYALVEIARGNPNYSRYESSILFTSKINLLELYYFFLRNYSQTEADRYLQEYINLETKFTITALRRAGIFKLENKKDKLSYADCTGYAIAEELGIPFLTGDIKFKDKENVEYVK